MKGKDIQYGATIHLSAWDVDARLWDWTDEPNITLSDLLERMYPTCYKWHNRYVFRVHDSEMTYLIDPKTKRIECINFAGGGVALEPKWEPDMKPVTPEEVRRALT